MTVGGEGAARDRSLSEELVELLGEELRDEARPCSPYRVARNARKLTRPKDSQDELQGVQINRSERGPGLLSHIDLTIVVVCPPQM